MRYTKQDIIDQLNMMGAPRNSAVIVHSSLRSVGEIEGGAQALLDALIEHFTAEGGLLCIPTHTWDNLGKPEKFTLDLATPENCLGALSTLAASDARGTRTENPTHSLVVFGDKDRVRDFIADETEIKTPTAPESCYGKICRTGGHVLLIGVSQARNTSLHAVAEILNLPDRMDTAERDVTVKRIDGEVVSRKLTLYDCSFTNDISQRFIKYETAFRYHRCTVDGFVGDAPTQLCDAMGMMETVKLIWERMGGEDPLASEYPIQPKWYCR